MYGCDLSYCRLPAKMVEGKWGEVVRSLRGQRRTEEQKAKVCKVEAVG